MRYTKTYLLLPFFLLFIALHITSCEAPPAPKKQNEAVEQKEAPSPAAAVEDDVQPAEENVTSPQPEPVKEVEAPVEKEEQTPELPDGLELQKTLHYETATPLELDEEVVVASSEPSATAEDYEVFLVVDDSIVAVHKTLQLTVWIGAEEAQYETQIAEEAVYDQSSIPATIGNYAKVTPFAPDFEITSEKEKCIQLHPSGSEVQFSLKPTAKGDFEVSANVEIFEDENCSGTPTPKATRKLKVKVIVDEQHEWNKKKDELGDISWSYITEYYGYFLGVVFSALLFAFRKKLFKLVGKKVEGGDLEEEDNE